MKASLPSLRRWVSAIFARCGMNDHLAALGAENLVRAEARGVSTHGLIRVKIYAGKMLSGELNARPSIRLDGTSGIMQVHADRGLGPAVGMHLVDKCMERASASGSVIAVIGGIGHMAALGIYALRTAEAGMLCLVMQATPRVMGMPGSRGGAIGNNPFAFGSPMPNGPPLVLDIASAAVARSRILRAAREGRAIPEGWGLDADGQPTTDAAMAMQGAQLPMAGYKGLGIAMMVECLAGSLSGIRPPKPNSAVGVNAPASVGAFMLVIDPRRAAIGDGYLAHVADWLHDYRRASGAAARYPGERAAVAEAEAVRDGIELSTERQAELTALGSELGVPFQMA